MHADDQHLIDTITKTTIGKHDVVVLTLADGAYRDMSVAAHSLFQVREQFRKRGLDPAIVAVPAGGDLRVLPDEDARQLYEHLKQRFAP